MNELFWQLFSVVCGQNPDHTWAPGQVPLVLCQRCTGLYVGAAVCVALHLVLRPRLGGRFLALHGLLLLIAAPFGLHWINQGPVLRTLTGGLCAFGIVTFLWLVPATAWRHADAAPRPNADAIYALGLCAALLLVPLAARFGGVHTGYALTGVAVSGLGALAGLVAVNAILGLRGFFRATRRWVRRTPGGPQAL